MLYGTNVETRKFLKQVRLLHKSRIFGQAQMLQDLWVLSNSSSVSAGSFVDVGACMPVKYSNSYILQKNFGWSGVLVEPNPRLASALRLERATTTVSVVEAALGSSRNSGKLVEYGPLSSLTSTSGNDMYGAKRLRRQTEPDGLVDVDIVTFDEVFHCLRDKSMINYLSIDVEGADLDVLRSFPFDKCEVHLITIEHNCDKNIEKQIDDLMTKLDYERVLKRWSSIDSWYVSPKKIG